MKKQLLLLLTLLLTELVSASTITREINDVNYKLDTSEKTAEVVNKSYEGDVTIPDVVTYEDVEYKVTSIGESAFRDCFGLTSVAIGHNVTDINWLAFYRCTKLETVTMGNKVKTIGDGAFSDCEKLTAINLSNTVTFIGSNAFYGCYNLTSINIPDGVTSIGSSAFYNCGALTAINIPAKTLSIGEQAFALCRNLSSVTIADGVTSIGASAFNNCSKLTSIVLPNSITTIGKNAFGGCGLTSIVIPEKVTMIDDYTFFGCNSLSSIKIPSSVISIGEQAFYGCRGFTSFTIPSSISSIGKLAFYSCDNLVSVTVKSPNPVSITNDVFTNCANATLHVPYGCKAAYESADYWKEFKDIVELSPAITFADANVKALCVANWDTDGDGELSEAEAAAVTDLGEVFRTNKLITSFNELQYFSGLTSIGNGAFYNCEKLTSIVIPDGVITIGSSAFYGCLKMASVTLPKSIKRIESSAFYMHGWDNSMTSVYITDLKAWCDIVFAAIESNPIAYGGHLILNGEEIKDLIIPDGVTTINESAFYAYNLTSVTIPSSVSVISKYAFRYCSQMTSLTISEGVETIGSSAFEGCTGLTSVTIPSSLTSLGDYAFSGCSILTSVTIEIATPISIASSVFSNRNNATLYVPAECKAAYEAADYWKEFKEIVEMAAPSPAISFADANVKALCVANWDTDGDGELSEAEAAAVTSLNDVFKGNNEIVSFTELAYFTGLNSINDEAFWKCKNLADIVIPDNVKKIGSKAFLDCYKLAALSLSASVTEIGWAAFSGCYSLTAITIADDNPKFDSRDNCNAIIETATNKLVRGCQNTIIPASVTSIDGYAFEGCQTLKTISIPESVTSIGDCAFAGCNMLESANIPNGVTVIGGSLFRYCEKLASINIPDGVTKIGIFAFDGCNSLTSISLPSSVETIEPMAFYCSNLTSVTVGMITPIALTDGNDFGNHANATLHVPAGCKAAYETADVWKEFKEIVEPPKCAMPTISLVGGKLHFECDTEDVEYHYDFTSASGNGTGNDVAISSTYMVKVYASKEGYTDSDVATANVIVAGLKGDANSDGEVDIADAVHIVNYVVGKIDQLAPRKDMDQADPE